MLTTLEALRKAIESGEISTEAKSQMMLTAEYLRVENKILQSIRKESTNARSS